MNIYNDYDKIKQYYNLLAVPGRKSQSREFNNMQTMLLDVIQRIGDSLFKNGNIVEGCSIKIEGKKKCIIDPGKIYFEGIVHETEGATLNITGLGDELIGVKLKETVITEADDETLLDPAVGSPAYLHPGAFRRKLELVFTVNDDQSATIVKLHNAEIINLVVDKPAMDTMSEVLARRTFDESGNYIVKGFEILDPQYNTENEILVGLAKGKAYIKGFEVQRPTDTTFNIKKSKSTKTVTGEPKVASSTSNVYTTLNHPTKTINRILVTAETIETVNRGAVAGTTDALAKSPIVSITEVKQSSTLYTPVTDYLLNGTSIDWSPTGAEPLPGTNYTVKYKYKVVLVEGTDYTVTQDETQTKITINNGIIVPESEILIDYEYYLARKDTVCLDPRGEVVVVEGQPDDLTKVVAPIVTDDSILKIGSICAMPNSDKLTVVNNTIKVSTMERIQNTINRVNDLEYNLSITDLDRQAMQGEPVTDLKGVYTDGFLNFNKVDPTYEGVDYSIDPIAGRLNLPYTEALTKLSPGSFPANNYKQFGNVFCCNYTEKLVLSQPFSTRTMLVNPYMVFTPTMGISIDPMVDNWIDHSTITVNQVNTTTTNLQRWWLHANDPWAQEEKQKWEAMGFNDPANSNNTGMGSGENNYLGVYSNEHITGSKNETILDEAIQFMRQTTVKVSSKTFPFSENNIQCKFDGRIVPLTPLNSTLTGALAGSVKATSTGVVEAQFTVPEGVPCGTKEVELFSENFTGNTSYTANGRKTITQETIYIERREVNATDPLAQTFQLDDTCNILSVDVYFAEKDGTIPAKIQLRNTVNGYPGNIVYGETVLTSAEIVTSKDATIPTKATFPNIIKCEKDTQYCIVVMTDSPKMSLHVAKLGERDTTIGKYITSNPYTAGVLFSSSNALTWTAHQDMDMKFNLYRAEYEDNGFIQFNSISPANADRIMLALEAIRPIGTEVKYEMSLNNGEWLPYIPWVDRFLNTECYKCDTRITMKSTGFQSPLISNQTIEIASWTNKKTAIYVSKTVTLPQGYKDIKVYLDTRKMAGTTYKAYYTTDPTASTWTELTNPKVVPLNEYFEQKDYTATLASEKTTYRVKLEMTTDAGYHRPQIMRLMNILKTL